MNFAALLISAGLVFSANVDAQTPLWISLDIRVTRDAIHPGETQTIEIWASHTPKGTVVAPNTTVDGLGFVFFDLHNLSGLESGTVTGFAWGPELQCWEGTVNANGDIVKSGAGVFPTWTSPSVIPFMLLAYEWTPAPDHPAKTIHIETRVLEGYTHSLWLYPANGSVYGQQTDFVYHDSAKWKVVPAPATPLAALVGTGILLARRRLR